MFFSISKLKNTWQPLGIFMDFKSKEILVATKHFFQFQIQEMLNNWYFLIIWIDVIEPFESYQVSYKKLVQQLCTNCNTILQQLCCCWYNLSWNKLMLIVFLVVKECFVVFEFELWEYLPRDNNDENFKRSLVISFS